MMRKLLIGSFVVTFLIAASPRPARAASDTSRNILIGALIGAVVGATIGVIVYLSRPKPSPPQTALAGPPASAPMTGVDLRRIDLDRITVGPTIADGDALAVWRF